jgi:hypothetical protein
LKVAKPIRLERSDETAALVPLEEPHEIEEIVVELLFVKSVADEKPISIEEQISIQEPISVEVSFDETPVTSDNLVSINITSSKSGTGAHSEQQNGRECEYPQDSHWSILSSGYARNDKVPEISKTSRDAFASITHHYNHWNIFVKGTRGRPS